MPFFARPNLDNDQFKQLLGTTLTLSGQTQIATVSGLTLYDDVNAKYIPIIVSGATDNYVLTYLDNKITLQPVSGVTGNAYSGMSPTTCTVGGLISGTSISSRSFTSIFQEMLVPPLYSTLTPPSQTFTINSPRTTYEVGEVINISGCTVFDRGCVNPTYYGTSNKRSGSAVCYEYNVWGVPTCVVSSLPDNLSCFTSYQAAFGGVNTVTSKVYYSSGCTPIYNSQSGCTAALPSGSTSVSTITINGIYPYYYGKVASGNVAAGVNRPSATAALITGGTKVICTSNSTICVNFNSGSDDYIWFATPAASTVKTCWYVDSANNGMIGGSVSVGGNLFSSGVTVNNVGNGCWSSQSYKLYISNYQTTSNKIIELRNN